MGLVTGRNKVSMNLLRMGDRCICIGFSLNMSEDSNDAHYMKLDSSV